MLSFEFSLYLTSLATNMVSTRKTHYLLIFSTSPMMSPSSSGLPPFCPKQFKMIPSRCPLKRLHRLRDIHDGSSSSVQATSLEYSESFYDEFVDSTGISASSTRVPSCSKVVHCFDVLHSSNFTFSHKDSSSSKSSPKEMFRVLVPDAS